MPEKPIIDPELELIASELESIAFNIRGGVCHASREQLLSLAELTHKLSSPAYQMITVGELCGKRWNISRSTLYNWIELGLVPKGHKFAHCNTLFWYSDEIDRIERMLVEEGYLKRSRIRSFFKALIDRIYY